MPMSQSMASSIDSCGMYCDMPTACSTVTMDTNAEFGIDAEPMAAKVAVMATTITFPADMCNPFACTEGSTHQHKTQQDYRHLAEPRQPAWLSGPIHSQAMRAPD